MPRQQKGQQTARMLNFSRDITTAWPTALKSYILIKENTIFVR